MKETHIFYVPDMNPGTIELPGEEAGHAVRVLRMKEGDTLTLTDGKGRFYEAEITLATPKHCQFNILNQWKDTKLWYGNIHLAVAPTKNMDRMEWLAEKATEIGFDRLSLLKCCNSERKVVKTERLEKIVVAAMKQSHKAFKPIVEELTPFDQFIAQPFCGQRFIAHCYNPEEVDESKPDQTSPTDTSRQELHLSAANFLGDLVKAEDDTLVLIGPEGDFSIDEVRKAIAAGFVPISLGESRLRTETAALVAVHLMMLAKRRR